MLTLQTSALALLQALGCGLQDGRRSSRHWRRTPGCMDHGCVVLQSLLLRLLTLRRHIHLHHVLHVLLGLLRLLGCGVLLLRHLLLRLMLRLLLCHCCCHVDLVLRLLLLLLCGVLVMRVVHHRSSKVDLILSRRCCRCSRTGLLLQVRLRCHCLLQLVVRHHR